MMEPAFHREYANKQSKPHAPLAAAANDGALPTDVLHDVLLRLPADELCRLRLVCRSWRSLTSHPTFAKAHSSRHPLVIGLRSVAGRHGHRDDDLEVQLLDPFSGGIVKRIPLGSHRDLMSAHHCRLFISVRYLPESACVVNPAAPGCITKLPTTTSMVTEHESKTSTIYSVLGQVPSTGEYKALRIIRPRERWWRQDYDPKQTSYHIATLGGNGSDGSRDEDISWRVMKSCPSDRISLSGSFRTVVNGVAYFLSYWKSPDEIAAFDLATEEWRHPLLRGPLSSQNITANEEDSVWFMLANLNGCLVSICSYNRGCHGKDRSMDLWFLVDADKELWTKRYSLRSASVIHPDGSFIPLWILGDGRVLVWVDMMEELRAYDPRDKRVD